MSRPKKVNVAYGVLTVLLPLARLSLATYTAASRIKTLNSSMLDPYLRITINATMPR
jgi:hypothetical protein